MEHVNISDQNIILSTKQNLLYYEGMPWAKKEGGTCDVTMGSWDGAEVSDLVGLYTLSRCEVEEIGLNIGLYRDDGLGVCNKRPQQIDNLKKKLCHIYRQMGLKITVDANIKIVNFLDVTLDLSRNLYKPFLKPNNPLSYVHKESNHPPSILRNIPESINRRLCELSKNEILFNESSNEYQTALDNSG